MTTFWAEYASKRCHDLTRLRIGEPQRRFFAPSDVRRRHVERCNGLNIFSSSSMHQMMVDFSSKRRIWSDQSNVGDVKVGHNNLHKLWVMREAWIEIHPACQRAASIDTSVDNRPLSPSAFLTREWKLGNCYHCVSQLTPTFWMRNGYLTFSWNSRENYIGTKPVWLLILKKQVTSS